MVSVSFGFTNSQAAAYTIARKPRKATKKGERMGRRPSCLRVSIVSVVHVPLASSVVAATFDSYLCIVASLLAHSLSCGSRSCRCMLQQTAGVGPERVGLCPSGRAVDLSPNIAAAREVDWQGPAVDQTGKQSCNAARGRSQPTLYSGSERQSGARGWRG